MTDRSEMPSPWPETARIVKFENARGFRSSCQDQAEYPEIIGQGDDSKSRNRLLQPINSIQIDNEDPEGRDLSIRP